MAVKQNEIVKFLFVVTVSNLLGSLFSTKGNSNFCLLLKKRSELFRCVTVYSDDFIQNLIVLTFNSQKWLICNFSLLYQGVKLCLIQAPMRLNFSLLATKSWKLVAKLATRTFHHNLTKRYHELKRFAKINPRQTSSLSLFPKRSTCTSIDN